MAERNPSRPTLARLARLYGVQASYTDGRGVRRHPSPESVRAVLEALGAPLATTRRRDVADASTARRRAAWARPVEPVLVAWCGRRTDFLLRRIETGGPVPVRFRLRLADGRTRAWTVRADDTPPVAAATVDGVAYLARRARLPARLPDGYHDLDVEIGNRSCRSLVVAAPARAYDDGGRTWGAFLPLHALQSAGSWGVGDFTDLEALAAWVASQGGGSVALLPALAAFLGEQPFEPSPYLPVSRLFWNELYVDPRRLPEFERCEPARRLVESAEFRRRVEVLHTARLVDYREAMALRRRVLERLARALEERSDRRHAAFRKWVERSPLARDYAAFRATGERLARARTATPPARPPAATRRGPLPAEPGERSAVRYHLYAQWAAAEQLGQLARNAAARGGGLHLDIPVGVHPDGFDVQRHPTLFARGAALGAPPDPLFADGQDWSAPPPHPGDGARGRLRVLPRQPRPPHGAGGCRTARSRHGAPPPVLDPPRGRARRRRLRPLPGRGAPRHRLPGIAPPPDTRGGREPGHGAALRQCGAVAARPREAARRAVRRGSRRRRTAGADSPARVRLREHARYADVRRLPRRAGYRGAHRARCPRRGRRRGRAPPPAGGGGRAARCRGGGGPGGRPTRGPRGGARTFASCGRASTGSPAAPRAW